MSNISKENDGVKYLLFVTDIFSRYLWIEPLKNKTGKEVVSGLKKVFSKGRKCRTFRVDRGKEFSNSHVMNYLKDEDVYFFTTQNSDTKANYAKRVIQTIKNMMYRFFTSQRNHRYLEKLQDIVKTYNATPHRSLNNIAPKDVNNKHEASL